MLAIRVRLPAGPLRRIRTGAGYGWPGRGANAVALAGIRVRIPSPPLNTLVVQRTGRHPPKVEVQVRFLAGVLTTDDTLVVKRKSLHVSTVAFRVRILAGVLTEYCVLRT